jgi:hypothetical protein
VFTSFGSTTQEHAIVVVVLIDSVEVVVLADDVDISLSEVPGKTIVVVDRFWKLVVVFKSTTGTVTLKESVLETVTGSADTVVFCASWV